MRTASLNNVEDILSASRGSTELDYERQKASRIEPQTNKSDSTMRAQIVQISEQACDHVDYLTIRRIGELIGFPLGRLQELVNPLRTIDERRVAAPLWKVRKRSTDSAEWGDIY